MPSEISIVVYHDISDGSDALVKHLSVSTRPEIFERHISYFSKNYDFVSEEDLLTGRLPKNPLLVTFDDAYRSVFDIAGPILRAANAPSIFFLISSVVQRKNIPLDNVLSLAAHAMGVPNLVKLIGSRASGLSSVGDIIASTASTMSLSETRQLRARILDSLGTSDTEVQRESNVFMNSEDVQQLERCCIAVGNHSMNHSHFRTLSTQELNGEIGDSADILRRISGQSVRSLSIPYGHERDATEAALATARASGHQAIFLVHARSNRFRSPGAAYYRISLQNQRLPEMLVSIKLLPVVRSLKTLVSQ